MSEKKEAPVLIERSPQDAIRDFFNLGKVRRVFRLGSEIFTAVQPFVEKPDAINGAKAAFLIGKVLVEDMEVWPDDFFDEGWEAPWPDDFSRIILKALKGKPLEVIRTSDESMLIHMHHFEGVKFGYILNNKTDYVDCIYVPIDKVEEAKAIIKSELWRQMKNDNIVLRNTKSQNAAYERFSSVSLEVDDAFLPMPSKRAGEYSSYLRKCMDAGVPRSVLLYGPPGTGKSTMARTIVDALGMKSFRIRVEDIAHLESSAVFEAISIFEPDAVILDDFDRSTMQEKLLETLEFFQRHVKLVIATVNNKNQLDEAILRPGRFDELVQIKQMDDDVVKAVLGDQHSFAYDTVKDWPIAFIQEYVKRLRFMSPEEATASVKELAQRVKRLSKYDDEEETVSSLEAEIPPPPPSYPPMKGGKRRKGATLIVEPLAKHSDLNSALRKAIKKKARKGSSGGSRLLKILKG